ncbi:MAG TPA: hydrogen peroxide-dependent heme synthase [Conexibacter sp.]|nr:hydrogen peroxide-dependent heme synthase [Conexibacter sp.]
MTQFETPYVLYGAFRVREPGAGASADAAAAEAALTGGGATLRGAYSLAGFKADADLLLWLVGPSADALQDAVVAFRRSDLGRRLDPVWTNVGVHRDAEFNKAHIPAFLQGEEPRKYLCVYPFVRSYEWYLLPPQERSDMLREHGMMARDFADVRANTVSAFALGDYEWLLAFEADELTRIVDLMRHLRGAAARRHTREELPFFTGIRKPLAAVVADLP